MIIQIALEQLCKSEALNWKLTEWSKVLCQPTLRVSPI